MFNIGTKQKLKAHLMNEEIVFWKWVSPDTLGIVTETAVWHWQLNVEGPPAKVSPRVYSSRALRASSRAPTSTESGSELKLTPAIAALPSGV